MPTRQHATQEIIGVALDPANGHIACSPGLTNVQPHCDMLQLGALQLVDGARIPWPDGIRCDVAALLDEVCDRVDGQMPAGLCLHVHTSGVRVVAFHTALHPIDENGLFVHVAGDVQPHTLVQFHLQRL